MVVMSRVEKLRRTFKLSKARWRDIVDTVTTALAISIFIVFVITAVASAPSGKASDNDWSKVVIEEDLPIEVNDYGLMTMEFIDRFSDADIFVGACYFMFVAITIYINGEEGTGLNQKTAKVTKIKRERFKRTKRWFFSTVAFVLLSSILMVPSKGVFENNLYSRYESTEGYEAQTGEAHMEKDVFVQDVISPYFEYKNLVIGSYYYCMRNERDKERAYVFIGLFGIVMRIR